jgi:hypothetical protein
MKTQWIIFIAFNTGFITGWLLRWRRDKKIADRMQETISKIKKDLMAAKQIITSIPTPKK